MQKIPVAILGATGTVGQKLIEMLENHPLFEIRWLCASKKSVGQPYQDVCPQFKNSKVAQIKVSSCSPSEPMPLVFSTLSSDVAEEIESLFIEKGSMVISNTKCFRMKENVPLLIPEVNAEHLNWIEKQPTLGKIITNPNCTVCGLAIALKPLSDRFGLKKVSVTSLQALSGGGKKLLNATNVQNNVLPHIEGEEEKIESEPLKILDINCPISAQSFRVPVHTGHTLSISVELQNKGSLDEIQDAFDAFNQNTLKLFSSPTKVIEYLDDPHFPQPKSQITPEHGMSIFIGKLRPCKSFDFKFNMLVDNLIRGAAGAALLNAELIVLKYPSLFKKKHHSHLQTV